MGLFNEDALQGVSQRSGTDGPEPCIGSLRQRDA